MKVIHRRNITWHDLPAIENPFFARNEVAHSRDALLGASRIWGVDEMLRENLSSCLEPSEDYHHYGFGWLLESVDDGEAVLIHDSGWRRPMRSVLCWSMENGAHHIPGHGDILSVEGRWIADPDLPLLLRREIEKCLEQGRRDEALNRGLPEKSWWGLWDGSRSGAGNASASDAAAADEESERKNVGSGRSWDLKGESANVQALRAKMVERVKLVRGAKWTIAELLGLLCPEDKAVVDDLAQTDVVLIDEIYHNDMYYEDGKWVLKRFDGGGTWDANVETLFMLGIGSPENAAEIAYHELIHKHQDPSMTSQDQELEAYSRTEQWMIKKGFRGNSEYRTKNPDGSLTVNMEAINDFIKREYPIYEPEDSEEESPPERRTPSGDVVLEDGSVRPPREGDAIPDYEGVKKNPRSIPRSVWKCPGEP